MIRRNEQMAKLAGSYLFSEINRRKREFLAQHPNTEVLSLGIGDTTEPIGPMIIDALVNAAARLGNHKGYLGYGAEQGLDALRRKIAEKIYYNLVAPDEIFISDGAKSDIGRLQVLFGGAVSIAIQDPAYPVYVDGSVIQGIREIHFLRCTPENQFFPDLANAPRTDLIYFCSPNNPTGAVATRAQLEALVAFAKKNRSLILYDSAYAAFIDDPSLPKSIYEIEGAKEVAIEISSFSKLAGFTGIRLGWTVIPYALKYENGASIHNDWNRIATTLFNGASVIAQLGGLAVLEENGWKEVQSVIDFYRENARLIKEALEQNGYEVFSGDHAPYLWVRFPNRKSWDVFQELLEKLHLVATPGSGFGPCGEGFMRFSAFGKRENVLKAIDRLRKI